MNQRVILFAFWGRRENIKLQLPFIHRILDENPNVEFHGWDLSRDPADSKYLRTIEGDRITIQTAFYGPIASRGQMRVWQHYTASHYRDCLFVKLDDDDVFLETRAFPSFIAAAASNPDVITSAKVINNGACTALEPELWDMFTKLDIPLLDVHLSADYAEQSHRWFFDHWQEVVDRPAKLTPIDTWLSINCLAYHWQMGRNITRLLNTRPPVRIADRTFTPRSRVGDEGAANMFPRVIHEGFVCGHLSFGPQKFSDGVKTELLKQYRDVGRQYLGSVTA